MQTFRNTTPILISTSIITIALFVAYIFLFSAIKIKISQAVVSGQKVSELSARQAGFDSAVSDLKAEASRITVLRSYYISENQIVSFTEKIEGLGVFSGAVVSIESLDPGVGVGGAPVLDFRIKAVGTFNEVMKTLSLLEKFPAAFEWRGVQIESNGNTVAVNKKSDPQWSLIASLRALNFVRE